MEVHRKYALVLAGGGAKGAYQIGAWKAFKELGIEFEAVTGASVGALNAALIAQGDFEKAEKLWDEMSLEKIVCIPPALINENRHYFAKGNLKNLRELNRSILKYGGLDSTPLLKLIEATLDEEYIRENNIDLGLVTFNIGKLKPVELFIDAIPEGMLAEYLLASASYPAFKRTKINGNKYTDGGIYDNIPFKMIKNRGYKNIIVVDISGSGWNRHPNIIGTSTTYIKNSVDIGGILNFDHTVLNELKELGYLDTLKVLDGIKGIKYFYQNNEKTENKLREIIYPSRDMFRGLLPADKQYCKCLITPLLDCSASVLGLPVIKNYDLPEMIKVLLAAYNRIKQTRYNESKRHFLKFYKNLISVWRTFYGAKNITHYPAFEYYHAINEFLSEKQATRVYHALNIFFPELPSALAFLEILEKNF